MKVIQVYKPLQNNNTKEDNLELVEYINNGTSLVKKIPHWYVMSENLIPNETYQEWLSRVREKITTGTYREKGIEGIYFYNIQAIVPIIDRWDENNEIKTSKDKFGMMVRYDYIFKK